MATKKTEHVNPVTLTDNDSGEVFTLDFNRESATFAENHGFRIADVGEKLVSGPADLFFYAFRANHRRVTRHYTDRLMDKMGGLAPELLSRLVDLFLQVVSTHSIADEDGSEKNSSVTVEL